MDFIGMTTGQGGPGGAGVLGLGQVGYGTPQSAGAIPNTMAQGYAPATGKGFVIPPVAWMFIFLIVGYLGLHVALKAV